MVHAPEPASAIECGSEHFSRQVQGPLRIGSGMHQEAHNHANVALVKDAKSPWISPRTREQFVVRQLIEAAHRKHLSASAKL